MHSEDIAKSLRESRLNPDAFAAFYRAYAEEVAAFVAGRVYDVDTAIELTAESFARAFLKRRSFRGTTDSEARGWLYAITSREITNYFRRNAVEGRAVRRLGMEVPRASEDDHERILELAGLDELRTAVRLELGRLSQDQQDALRLRVVDERSYGEVAAELGISEQAARARVARGLKALGSILDGYKQMRKGLAQ